jgi:hypothetical protein
LGLATPYLYLCDQEEKIVDVTSSIGQCMNIIFDWCTERGNNIQVELSYFSETSRTDKGCTGDRCCSQFEPSKAPSQSICRDNADSFRKLVEPGAATFSYRWGLELLGYVLEKSEKRGDIYNCI